MRHGDALSAALDARRPLSPSGRADVEAMARRALAQAVEVSWIYHSGILRAQQTAELMAARLAPPLGLRELAGLCPDDDPFIVKAELEGASQPALLVSHLPYLGRLASLLVSGDSEGSVIEFTPATIVCLTRQAARWKLNWRISPAGAGPG